MRHAYACPINVFFDCKMGSKKGYMEMSKKIYLEVIILVPSASISHYSLRKPENRDPSGTLRKPENRDPSGTLQKPENRDPKKTRNYL